MIKPWILAASAVMGAIILFAGLPFTTWAKSCVRRGVAWSKVVLWIPPAGAVMAFALAAWNGLSRLAVEDLSDAAVGARVRAEAVALSVQTGAYALAATVGVCVVILVLAEARARAT